MRVLSGIGVLLLATMGEAACVNPGGTAGCFDRIQNAVDAAAAGETVSVEPGSYRERVTVGATKTGLVLTGTGASPSAVVIDGGPPSSTGHVLTVSADDATIRNLTVRNAVGGDGIQVTSNTTGVTIQLVHVRQADDDCIEFAGGAHSGLVLDSQLSVCEGDGIVTGGNTMILQRNVLKQVNGVGMRINGFRAVVEDNQFMVINSNGILVNANFPEIRRNQFLAVESDAINVNGDDPVVEQNFIQAVDDEAIRVTCTVSCLGRVTGNQISDVGDSPAILVIASVAGFRVESNVVIRSEVSCIRLEGTGVVATFNDVTDCGMVGAEGAIEITGTSHRVRDNVARWAAGPGFLVTGSGHILRRNIANRSSGAGFDIESLATGTLLQGNQSAKSGGPGFQNDGANATTLTGNTSTGDRVPFCDAGTNTVLSGNSFAASELAPGCLFNP